MDEIGFVITNYKYEAGTVIFIKEQVNKLELSNSVSLKIVIVDIESTKESRIYFSNHLEISNCANNYTKNSKNDTEIFLLYEAENVGYAKGNNIGVNFLMNTFNNINYFVISNNDILFP